MDAIQCLTPMISFGIFGFIKSMDAGHRYSARLEKAILVVGDTVVNIVPPAPDRQLRLSRSDITEVLYASPKQNNSHIPDNPP